MKKSELVREYLFCRRKIIYLEKTILKKEEDLIKVRSKAQTLRKKIYPDTTFSSALNASDRE